LEKIPTWRKFSLGENSHLWKIPTWRIFSLGEHSTYSE
jgi:hypothetical protein